MMKKIILITGIFVSFFLSGNAQMNVRDSVIKTIHLYDSLILAIEKDTALLKKKIIGAAASKSYEGFAFIVSNRNELSKLDLLIGNTNEERAIVYLHKNSIINISIAESNHYIINNSCFTKEGIPAPDHDEIFKSVLWYQGIVKGLIDLFFVI